MKEKGHRPVSFIRFPELEVNNRFDNLNNSKFLDPYLREFLYKFYHGRLFFKKYKIDRDDLLNSRSHQCILCRDGIETPNHVFTYCKLGKSMRLVRNKIVNFLNVKKINFTPENLIYANFKLNKNENNVIQYVISLSNYIIYTNKMKKFYNVDSQVSEDSIKFSFLHAIKKRIVCDHKLLNQDKFIESWDPGGREYLFNYNYDKIISWNI